MEDDLDNEDLDEVLEKKAKPKKTKKSGVEPIEFEDPKRPHNPNLPKNYYFDNEYVESLLTEYVKGGCTDIELRNEIMSNASELIRQIIRTHKLHLLGSGREGSTFGDLYQTAWAQLESALYKFDYQPGHTKVFNMWSQIAKTVMLAHVKKESRDKRNSGSYKDFLDSKKNPRDFKLERFLEEARDLCQFNEEQLKIVDALENLMDTDNKPHDGLIDKLVKRSKMSRAKVSNFLRIVRLRSFEFTDSPANEELIKPENKHRVIHSNYDAEED